MTTLLVLQLLLPTVMLAWLVVAPASSRVGRVLQMTALGTWLLAIALCGVWTALPWWTPHILGNASAATVVWRLASVGRVPVMPRGWRGGIGAALCLVIAVLALQPPVAAIQGRQEPAGLIAELRNPVPGDTFLVINGGSHASINAHMKTLSPNVPRYRNWRGQSYGVDLVRIGVSGVRARGLRPQDPTRYAGFGFAVLAPCAGTIVRAVDGFADNPVPQADREQMAGNHVIVRCQGFDVVLAHLRRGSVAVSADEPVIAGQQVGELGNSGNSDEPHLHVHAQRTTPPGAPFSGEPVPLRIDGRFPVRNDRLRDGRLARTP